MLFYAQIDTFVEKVEISLSSSDCNTNNLSELRKYSTQVCNWYSQCMDNYCGLFDNLSKDKLKRIFGANDKYFQKLKTLKQRLKLNMNLNETNLNKFSYLKKPMKIPQPTSLLSSSTDTGQSIQKSASSDICDFSPDMKNDGLSDEFDGYGYAHSELMQKSLRDTFGLNSIRSNQLKAINATMSGIDCFVLMSTGGGKSLCYQLPAILTEMVTIVVVPLKSLIFDQVTKLQALKIRARNLSGQQTAQEISDIYQELKSTPPLIDVLYVTYASETLQDVMKELYEKGLIARFVIDEAHCIR